MTVTSSVNKQFYTGNGSVTTFAINSLSGDVLTGLTVFDDDDVKVYLDGVLKTKTTHYTISSTTPPASFAGKLVNANVVFLTAPANGVAVAIVRDIPVTQDLLLSNGNNVPPKPLESQLDKIVVQNQQLAGTLVVDVVRIGGFESASGIDPITIENDKYLKWVGNQLTNADPIAIGVDISNATVTQVATNTANITALDGRLDVLEPLKNPTTAGNALEVVRVNSGATAYEVVPFNDLLPSQTGNANKVLTTNGTDASWGNVPFATVNFDGTTAANLTGTFTRTLDIVTANVTGHGHQVGHRIYFVGAGVTSNFYTVASVIDANSFTFDSGVSGAIGSTACTLQRRSIRKSTNVQSVAYATVGNYAINLLTLATDANYTVSIGCSPPSAAPNYQIVSNLHCISNTYYAPTTASFHLRTYEIALGQNDVTFCNLAVFP